ncbi:MAG: DNRLRE domain-containing protein, partial [Ardenticatenales bacterium]
MFVPPTVPRPSSPHLTAATRLAPAARRRRTALLVAAAAFALAAAAIVGVRHSAPVVRAAREAERRLSALQAIGGTTCITPSADATVDSEQPTATLGGDNILQVARVRAASPQERWSYVRFATTTLPSGIELVSATLELKIENTIGLAPFSQAIFAVTGPWAEKSITWANRPRAIGPYGNTAFGGQAITVTADVTPLVEKWLSGSLPNEGLALEPDSDFDTVWFDAREFDDPPHEPLLCIQWRLPTPTPKPTDAPSATPTNTTAARASATPTGTDTPKGATATVTSTLTSTPASSATPSPTTPPTATASPTRVGTPQATPTEGSSSLDLTVDDAGNGVDAQPGDGVCRTSAGRCTLRAALQEADKNAASDVRILFAAAVRTIDVPAGGPALTVQRTNVTIDGRTAPPRAARAARAAPAARAQASGFVRLVGPAGATGGALPGLAIDGARGIVVDGMSFEGFAVGVAVLNRSSGIEIGGAAAGRLGNRFTRNVVGLAVDASSSEVGITGNEFLQNRADGLLLARTSGAHVRLLGNRITGNGNAAIAVAPAGAQTDPPRIATIDPTLGVVRGTTCAGCTVELFADRGVQAGRVTGLTALGDSRGEWSIRGFVAGPDDTHLTATATRDGDTSRLSSALAVDNGVAWMLSERPGASPAALRGRRLVRSYILRDESAHLVNTAVLRFLPEDLDLQFPVRTGFVDVSLPVEIAAAVFSRKLHTSLEAVERNGVRHSVRWTPNLAVAVAQIGARPGDVLLDLLGLGPLGLGARLRLDTFVAAGSERPANASGGRVGPLGARAVAANDDAYAAAYIGAPAELREGPYAWTQTIAAGGGIYELQAGTEAVSGPLEIVAPVDAFNAGGAASGCPGSGAGAVV